MYKNVDQSFINAVVNSGRTFKARAVFDDLTLSDNIKTYVFDFGSDEIMIGNAYSAELELVVFGQLENLRNKKFVFELGLQVNGEFVYIPVGHFIVKLAAFQSDITTIDCADYMYLAEKTYTPTYEFPQTVDYVTKDILKLMGLETTQEFATDRYILATPINYSMREVLGICALIQGSNAFFDRHGEIQYKWWEQSEFEITDEQIKDPTIYDSDFVIDYLEVEFESEVLVVGDPESDQGIFLKSEFLNQLYVDDVFEKIGNFAYRPAEVDFIIANPLFDPWDVIKYKTWNIPCMKMQYNFDGGLWANLTTYVQDVNKDYSSPTEREEERQETSQSNNRLILDEFNRDFLLLGSEQNIFVINFTTKSTSLPVFEFTAQVEVSRLPEPEPPIILDPETNEPVFPQPTALPIEQEVLLIFDVVVNGTLLFSYKNTLSWGHRVLNFIIPIKNLSQGGHNLAVFGRTEDGTERVTIDTSYARGIMWGDGLLAIGQWDGTIQISEPIAVDVSTKIALTDNVIASTQVPKTNTITDVLSLSALPSVQLSDTVIFEMEEQP